jgi:hypothetical protein
MEEKAKTSSFGQCLIKTNLFFFLLLILLCYYGKGIEIGMSPNEIDFNGRANEAICRSFKLYSDGDIRFIGETRWSTSGERNLNEYNLDERDIRVNVSFPRIIEIFRNKTGEICIIAKQRGKYSGALLYRAESYSAGVGSWIKADIDGGEEVFKWEDSLVRIKKEERKDECLEYMIIAVFMSQIGLESAFLVLVMSKRRKLKKRKD